MSASQHTPIAQTAMGDNGKYLYNKITNKDGRLFCEVPFSYAAMNNGDKEALGRADDIAAFIVRACNSHEALVEALEIALAHLRGLTIGEMPSDDRRALLATIHAALKLAKP